MKIGVFGDSYAESGWKNRIWWRCLEQNHNHVVQSFGSGGSSILYSAKLIEQHASKFDFLIWCLTCPGRVTFEISDSLDRHFGPNPQQYFHYTNKLLYNHVNLSPETIKKISVYNEYVKYIYNDDDEFLISASIANYFLTKYKNLMIIPCFQPPLDAEFNLYNVCSNELKHYFPDHKLEDVYKDYQDLRPGHLTNTNNKILAELINQNLQPGIFQTDYSNFQAPTVPITEVLEKRKL